MAEIKSLQFTDGVPVTPPSDASNYFVQNNFTATTNPTVTDDTDDGYVVGSQWVNTSTGDVFVAVDVTAGAADWKNITSVASLLALSTKTADYTTTSADNVILVDAISNDVTITLHSASGNAGQSLFIKRLDDTAEKIDTFVDGDVTVGTDNINVTSHPFYDLQRVQLTTSGTLPTGLATATDYYVIYVDADNIKLASSRANAEADTAVDITAASGGGTHTITSQYNDVLIDANGSETIDGNLTKNLSAQYDNFQITSDNSNWNILKETASLIGFIDVASGTTYRYGVAATTSPKTVPLISTSGDLDLFGSIDSNQLTLHPGEYDIVFPVGANNGSDVNAKFYDVTGATDMETFVGVSAAASGATISFTDVKFRLTVTSTNVYEFRTYAASATGAEYAARIKIIKRA